VTFLAAVNYTGNTSMEIGVKVITENIQQQVVRHTNSCYFTMVAMGENGKPSKVPPLQPSNADERHRFAAAKLRKQLRQESEQRYQQLTQTLSDAG
jgi:acyl-CoA hydrolase